MKRYMQLIAVTIFAALACTGLRAQTVNLWATIPFDFNAGGKLMPAGEYLIQEQGYLVVFHGVNNGNPNIVLMTAAGDQGGSRAGCPCGFQPVRQHVLPFDHLGFRDCRRTSCAPDRPRKRASLGGRSPGPDRSQSGKHQVVR